MEILVPLTTAELDELIEGRRVRLAFEQQIQREELRAAGKGPWAGLSRQLPRQAEQSS